MSDETFSLGTTLIVGVLLIVFVFVGMICCAIYYGLLALFIALLYILEYIVTVFVELINNIYAFIVELIDELTNYINVHSGELLMVLASLLLVGFCFFLLSKYYSRMPSKKY